MLVIKTFTVGLLQSSQIGDLVCSFRVWNLGCIWFFMFWELGKFILEVFEGNAKKFRIDIFLAPKCKIVLPQLNSHQSMNCVWWGVDDRPVCF